MITNEGGKLAKKALTKIKINLILLQKLVEDYNLYESIYKLTTDTSSIVEYIDDAIQQLDPGVEGVEETEEGEEKEILSITNTEIETMYTAKIAEIKSSITTLLSETEGYITNHC